MVDLPLLPPRRRPLLLLPRGMARGLCATFCAKTFASQKTLKRHRPFIVNLAAFRVECATNTFTEGSNSRGSTSVKTCRRGVQSFHYRGHVREHLKTHHPATTSLPPTSPATPLAPPASALHSDARTCPADLPVSVPEDCRQCYRDNWSQIRSGQRGGKHVLVHTRRLEAASDIGVMLLAIFCTQKKRVRSTWRLALF